MSDKFGPYRREEIAHFLAERRREARWEQLSELALVVAAALGMFGLAGLAVILA